MITLIVTYCLILNPYVCRSLEMVPDGGRRMTSTMECIMGGAIGSTSFTMENMAWQVKGWRCVEKPTMMQTWLDRRY